MAQFRITINGDKQVAELLHTIEQKKVKPALRKGTRAAAKVVSEKVKALAPTDEGDYRKSIKVRAQKRSRRNKHVVGHRVISSSEWMNEETFYGNHLEFGTSKMQAKPHWRPAMLATAGAAISHMRDAVAGAIAKARAK